MNMLSLFSGCGGMDLGFEGGFSCFAKSAKNEDWIESREGNRVRLKKTDFNTVFANDIRPDAQKAWINYFKNKIPEAEQIYRLESVVELVEQAKKGEFEFPKEVDVVTGGFPCQDFSVSGKRAGFNSKKSHNGGKILEDDPAVYSRGNLYIWMRDVVSLTLPKVFVAENVKGLTNLKDAKEVIESDFSKAGGGYLVIPARVLYAPDYGVPQSRERVIFYGFKKSALKSDALEALSKSSIDPYYDPYPSETHRHHHVTCADEHGGKHIRELKDSLPERRLSVRECARIQTFPDDYQFIIPGRDGVSASSAYKLIGNAVPPVLAFNIAMTLQKKWERWFI